MEPFLVGGHMIRKVQADGTTWGDLPHKFEAGTAPMAEAVGFGAAIVNYQLNAAGLEAIDLMSATSTTSPPTHSSSSRTYLTSGCSGLRPTAGRASSRSPSTTSTLTTSRRCSTGKASLCAQATIAASR